MKKPGRPTNSYPNAPIQITVVLDDHEVADALLDPTPFDIDRVVSSLGAGEFTIVNLKRYPVRDGAIRRGRKLRERWMTFFQKGATDVDTLDERSVETRP